MTWFGWLDAPTIVSCDTDMSRQCKIWDDLDLIFWHECYDLFCKSYDANHLKDSGSLSLVVTSKYVCFAFGVNLTKLLPTTRKGLWGLGRDPTCRWQWWSCCRRWQGLFSNVLMRRSLGGDPIRHPRHLPDHPRRPAALNALAALGSLASAHRAP